MAKIFLSYAREDVDAAKQLGGCIASAGHEVWWDRHIQGGSRFTNEIDRALKDAQAVVVLWSDASVSSAWVQDEAAEGRDTGRLVPVALGGCRPPLGFRQFHTIELGQWDGRGDPQNLGEVMAAIAKSASESSTAPEAAPAAKSREHKASVCVLPFVNMSGDPEQEYFSDGITEDIITDLSKVSALSVVARNTAFMFKGQTLDVKDVARSQGVSSRARRQRPQGRHAGPHHRPADRRGRRRPCLGRPVRSRARRHFRDPGRDFEGDRRRLAASSCCPKRKKRSKPAAPRASRPITST